MQYMIGVLIYSLYSYRRRINNLQNFGFRQNPKERFEAIFKKRIIE